VALFFEQRRFRHFGWAPDRQAMKYIRALVAELERREGVAWLWERVDEYRAAEQAARAGLRGSG
jgi:hypothetical protein